MKKLFMLCMVFGLVAGLSTGAFAAISGGSHDLSDNSLGTDQICIFCHTPHNGDSAAPLWNRGAASGQGSFTLYDGTTSASVTGTSILCLSCHDGVTNLDAFGGAAGTATIEDKFSGTTANVGIDLRDDHPVSIVYGSAGTGDGTDLKASPTGDLASQLESTKVECGTCHDAHTSESKFLVGSNSASALCLSCHLK